jgi:uncharacterized protein YkwD
MRSFKIILTSFALLLTATFVIRPTIAALELQGGSGLGSESTGPARLPRLSPQWPQVPLVPVEQRVFEMVNEERAKLDLTPLQVDATLMEIARGHSADMLERGFFDHVNPDGDGPADRVAQGHRRLIGAASENVWTGIRSEIIETEELAGRIMNGLMNSPGHRANILAENLTHLGVGVTRGPGRRVMTWQTMATQLFAEVAAYTVDPVPDSFSWGSLVNFSVSSGARIGRPERFDLWSIEEDRRVFGPGPVRQTRLHAPAGTYDLRFYFRVGSSLRFVIHSGPQVVVQ